jgi:OOP family OmpA-OmpF porin
MEGIATANEAARQADALCSRKPGEPPPKPAMKQGKETVALLVEFDFDKTDVKPKHHDDIARVAAYMKKYPKTKVTIEGHADIVGGKAYNQKLSERRAESVKKYMIGKFGVDPSRIATKGYGKSRPIADNKSEEGRQRNRRVVEAIFR